MNKTQQKLVINISSYILIFAFCFIGSIIFVNSFMVYPESLHEGTKPITFFNYLIGEQIVQIDENGISHINIVKTPLYNYLPFLIALFLFLICIMLLFISKKLLRKLLVS